MAILTLFYVPTIKKKYITLHYITLPKKKLTFRNFGQFWPHFYVRSFQDREKLQDMLNRIVLAS